MIPSYLTWLRHFQSNSCGSGSQVGATKAKGVCQRIAKMLECAWAQGERTWVQGVRIKKFELEGCLLGNFKVITSNIQFCYNHQLTPMIRPSTRNASRKPSQDSRPVVHLQQKKNNQIKTRMPSKDVPKPKDTRRQAKFVSQVNVVRPDLLLTKQNLSRSEQDTKVSELEESESEITKVAEGGAVGGRSNAELEQYREEIREYVLEREEKYMIDHGYMRHHRLLTVKMRSYLVRHILRMCIKFDLLRTTAFLAVHYMDLYFARVFAFRDQFETVAVAQACLFIAMKYEEIYPPELGDWVDHRHKADIIRLEADILRALDFQLAHYTLEHFLHFHLWQGVTENSQQRPQPSERTLLLMDLALFDLPMRQFRPSQLAQCLHLMAQPEGRREAVEQLDRNMVQNVNWMIERNNDALNWLLDHKYRGVGVLFD